MQERVMMAMNQNEMAKIVHDPNWLAHRYDATRDSIQFVHAPRTAHRGATFLTDEHLPGHDRPRVVDRNRADENIAGQAPLHFIFHSAYCCSTLLARAIDIEGVSMGLKEPVILNDISGWRRRGADPKDVAAVLKSSLSLLARPFSQGEAVVIKPSNVINAIAPAILAIRPEAHALLLYAPLRHYLGSIAEKGLWGRLWVRELFIKLTKDGVTDYGFSPEEIMGLTDLQIAAIGWLAQHRLFASMISRFGESRIKTMDSETLLADPEHAMRSLSNHFSLPLSAEMIASIATGPAFTKHSKTGDTFDRETRQSAQGDRSHLYADEIDKVAIWANSVAESAGQSLVLDAVA